MTGYASVCQHQTGMTKGAPQTAVQKPSKKSLINRIRFLTRQMREFTVYDLTLRLFPDLDPNDPKFPGQRNTIWGMIHAYNYEFTRVARGIYRIVDEPAKPILKRTPMGAKTKLIHAYLTQHGTTHYVPLAKALGDTLYPGLDDFNQQHHLRAVLRQKYAFLNDGKGFYSAKPGYKGRQRRGRHGRYANFLTTVGPAHNHTEVERTHTLEHSDTKNRVRQHVLSHYLDTQRHTTPTVFVSFPAVGWAFEEMLLNSTPTQALYGLEVSQATHKAGSRRARQLAREHKTTEIVHICGQDRDLFLPQGFCRNHIRSRLRPTTGVDGLWLDWMGAFNPSSASSLQAMVATGKSIFHRPWNAGNDGFLAVTVTSRNRWASSPDDIPEIDNLLKYYGINLPRSTSSASESLRMLTGISLFLNHHAQGPGYGFVPTSFASYTSSRTPMALGCWKIVPKPVPIPQTTLAALTDLDEG